MKATTKKEDKLLKEAEVAGKILGWILAPFFALPALMLAGFFFMHIFNWWIAKTFGIPEINYIQAMGIEILLAYLRTDHYYKRDTKVLRGIFFDILYFGVAYVLTFFL